MSNSNEEDKRSAFSRKGEFRYNKEGERVPVTETSKPSKPTWRERLRGSFAHAHAQRREQDRSVPRERETRTYEEGYRRGRTEAARTKRSTRYHREPHSTSRTANPLQWMFGSTKPGGFGFCYQPTKPKPRTQRKQVIVVRVEGQRAHVQKRASKPKPKRPELWKWLVG